MSVELSKKRKKSLGSVQASQNESSPSSPKKKKKKEKQNNTEPAAEPDADSGQLTIDEIHQLLTNVQQTLPATDSTTYQSMLNKLNWESVKLKGYTTLFCKSQWEHITKSIRKTRTMSEINNEALKMSEEGELMNVMDHPDKPKQPLTPYMQFYHQKYKKVRQHNKDLGMTQMSKLIGDMYNALSPSKKKKYSDRYAAQKSEFAISMLEFRSKHPEYGTQKQQRPTTTTAMKIYIDEHIKNEDTSNKSEQELRAHYREKWASLKGRKKLKYFNKALEAKKVYDLEVEKFKAKYPSQKLPTTNEGFLTKSEWKLKVELEGKPAKPPFNAYQLWKKDHGDLPKEEANKQWKDLDKREKARFRKKCGEKHNEYINELEKYIDTLPESEREKVRNESKRFRKQKAPTGIKKKNKVIPFHLFMVENTEKYREQFPTFDHEAIVRIMTKEFDELHGNEKLKHTEQNSSTSKKKKGLLPGEPKTPGRSLYQFFCTKIMEKDDTKGNITVAAQKWKQLTAKKKAKYQKEYDQAMKQYEEEIRLFREEQSEKDNNNQAAIPSTSSTVPATQQQQQQQESSDEESSSGEEESSSDDDGSSSEDERTSSRPAASSSVPESPGTVLGTVVKQEVLSDNDEMVNEESHTSEDSDSDSESSDTDNDSD